MSAESSTELVVGPFLLRYDWSMTPALLTWNKINLSQLADGLPLFFFKKRIILQAELSAHVVLAEKQK